ncbi:hypothetical protein DICVIV_06917 [Dictyocaulus viviparus]|uniref:Uncharacterized protein n=1 Tax=Dictyocaulus viviparus TaxID=29172 RepID=A0A0D8XT40_DICVI|nr:hypothetical protein DICVIV_06917 [Dictyocaulus viviparus]
MLKDTPLLEPITNEENSIRLPAGRSAAPKKKTGKRKKSKSQNASTLVVSRTQSENLPLIEKKQESLKAKNGRKSRESDKKRRKQEYLKKILEKGLSPPKGDEFYNQSSLMKSSIASATQSTSLKMISMIGTFDNTQWERTRFAKEAAPNGKKPVDAVKLPEIEEAEKKADAPLLGETKQTAVIRGAYLNEKPKITIILLGVEVFWCLVCVIVWSAAADNPMMPLLLAIFNMLVVFLLILTCMSIEICEMHIARAILLCANITIMSFDDDFDIASIIVLALTPIHLILAAIHILISLRPKRQ